MHEKGTVLVIKVGALGDVVRTSFLAQALKEKTNKKIIWLTSKVAKDIFINNPYVDEVVSVEDKNILEANSYDEIISLEEDKELCKFASLLKSKKITGFNYDADLNEVVPTETAKETFNMSYIGPKPMNDILKIQNEKTHRQLVGEIAGVDWERYEPFLKLTEEQLSIRENFMKRNNLSEKELIVGINSGGADTWPKALSIKKTVELIEKIYNSGKYKILLFGGPNEVERNDKICALAKVPIINTGCGNDLKEFPALISICNLVISTDSLGLHISLALKRKTIVMIGPTSVSELGLYGLGEKIIAKSDQVCRYSSNNDPYIMDKIDLEEVISAVKKLENKTISLIITSFKEKTLGRAIEAALNQNTSYNYNVIVVTPEEENILLAKSLGAIPFKDPGEGKSFALNMVFNNVKSDILIFTDGDVFIAKDAVENIVNSFSDPGIGCVTGRPVPEEDRSTKYGYWANILFNAAHRMRKQSFDNHDFIECSAYLFAFKGGHIKDIPLDVAEDAYIPYKFIEKGYRIGYVDNAKVYIKNVDNIKDWMLQKIRTSKAHETLDKYVDTRYNQRAKSFSNEAKGILPILKEASTLKELYWTMQLIIARGYMWAKVKVDTKIRNKHYNDGWETPKSTK